MTDISFEHSLFGAPDQSKNFANMHIHSIPKVFKQANFSGSKSIHNGTIYSGALHT
jgi:hypothetical protein